LLLEVVCEPSQEKLYFYEQSIIFFEQFNGEIVWKQLRLFIQQILGVSDHP
jgi:hypothetical protein